MRERKGRWVTDSSDDDWVKETFGALANQPVDPYPYGTPTPEMVRGHSGCMAILLRYGVFYGTCGNPGGQVKISGSGALLFLCSRHRQFVDDSMNQELQEKIESLQAILDGRRSERDELDRRRKIENAKREVVYFFKRSDGAIKIGRSVNIKQRKKSLESAAGPLELLGTISGGAVLETTLHDHFAKFNIHGEWFSPDRTILDLIACNNGAVRSEIEWIGGLKILREIQNGRSTKGQKVPEWVRELRGVAFARHVSAKRDERV